MRSILDKKFTKVWQSLKNNAGVKASPWFKKADAAICKKIEAYQEALLKAQSGLVEDLLKLGKALRDLEEAFVKFVDVKGLGQIRDAEAKECQGDVGRGNQALQEPRSSTSGTSSIPGSNPRWPRPTTISKSSNRSRPARRKNCGRGSGSSCDLVPEHTSDECICL